jgi:transcriptional regulator with XRE-family HTH domain
MEEETAVPVGQRIREERERSGKRIEDLAGAIGVSESYLSRIERGERGLDSLVLRKIASELTVAMDRFFMPASHESVHARVGGGSASGMRRMIDWGRTVQDDLLFVLGERGQNAG